MKTTSTLKSLLGAGLLLLAGTNVSFSQTNNIGMTPPASETASTPLTSGKTYTIEFSESLVRDGGSNGINVSSGSGEGVTVGPVSKKNGKYALSITIPEGFNVSGGGVVVIQGTGGTPLWHVTVADILGQAPETGNEEEHVFARPVNISEILAPQTGNNGSATIVQPNSGATVSDVFKNQPKADLYPNPANDVIQVVTEGEVLWGVTEVIDLTGKKILEVPVGANSPAMGVDRISIQVSQLKPGTYFLRFKTNKDTYTKKFQVAR